MLQSLYAEACLRMQEADGSAFDLRNLFRCASAIKVSIVDDVHVQSGKEEAECEQRKINAVY